MNLQQAASLCQQAIRSRCFHPTGKWHEFPASALDSSIAARFEAMVARFPDRLAIKSTGSCLTYHELNRAANQVAHAILHVAPQPPQFVALLLDDVVASVVAILAILKTGLAYIPLDPSFPVARNRLILADTQTNLLLTNGRNWAQAEMLNSGQQCLLNLDEAMRNPQQENPGREISPEAISHLLYTSGSTGQPKGVMHNQRNMLHCVMQNSNYLHICAEDRHPLFSACSTNAGIYSLFGALLNGAALIPYMIQERGVANLAQWLQHEAITFCDLTPSAFRQIVTDPSNAQGFPHLRVLYLGGERVTAQDVHYYRRYLPSTTILVTGFAATETCSEICHLMIDQETKLTRDVVPLGYAVPSMSISLLDESRQPVGPGQVGEIAVKSRYVALGYWQQPVLTQTHFLPDSTDPQQRTYLTGDLGFWREDGALVHLGRTDFQLKVRGNRVDIGDIEAALLSLGWVKQAAVTSQQHGEDETALVAYLVAQETNPDKPTPTVSQVRTALAERLPSYMIPAKFVFLASLPTTSSGKIDRQKLPKVPNRRPSLDAAYRPPLTPIEAALATIWEDVLGIPGIGAADPFLDLGGNSLQAMQIAAGVQTEFDMEISPPLFFAAATVAQMALLITEQMMAQSDRLA